MTPHHRRDDESGAVHHEREEDRNPFARLAVFAERYKLLWIVAMAVAMWIGNRVVQPLNMISEVAASQTVLMARVTAAEKTQADMAHAISILTKIACVKNLSAADQYAFGVTCADLPVRQPERQ